MQGLFGSNQMSGSGGKDALIKESSTKDFVADVIEPSMQVPVLVDFWATWCSPCKLLGPALEKAILAAEGKVRLVKIDVDKEQQLAAQLRIQSVPTIYVFKDGQVVDGFTGAVSESELKAFIARYTGGNPEEEGLAAALDQAAIFLEEGDAETALDIYKEVLSQDNANAVAFGGLLQAMIALGQTEEANDLLNRLPTEIQAHPDVARQKTALQVIENAKKLGPAAALEEKLAADENDHQARFDLASAKFAAGLHQEAFDLLLELFRRDRDWQEGAARKQILQFFDALEPENPLIAAVRRRLSSLMFS